MLKPLLLDLRTISERPSKTQNDPNLFKKEPLPTLTKDTHMSFALSEEFILLSITVSFLFDRVRISVYGSFSVHFG